LNSDFLLASCDIKYDIILANPPYAGTSKNRGLSTKFIEKALDVLRPGGYMAFLVPNTWMSCSYSNTLLVKRLLHYHIIQISIHHPKRYFPKVGVMFTWFVLHKVPCIASSITKVEGIWNKELYNSDVRFHQSVCQHEGFIPLFCTQSCIDWLATRIQHEKKNRNQVMTSNDLHYHNHKKDLSITKTHIYKYELVHTPSQLVFSRVPHKYQNTFNVFLPLTSSYKPFIKRCGMTQGIAFIPCHSENDARRVYNKVSTPEFAFIISICRWGNFNSVYMMKKIY
jgi:hypothetical protein